jgi:hypothetical protein
VNIGFPARDFEIAHVKAMLTKVRKNITTDQVEMLAKPLTAIRDVKLPSREGPHPGARPERRAPFERTCAAFLRCPAQS